MLLSSAAVLDEKQLQKLRDYRYLCREKKLLDRVFEKLCITLTARLPVWLSPNLIAILGLAVNVITTLILARYGPDAQQELPKWVIWICAVGLLMYHLLYELARKQAERTPAQSPLEELFLCGCKVFSVVLTSLNVYAVLKPSAYEKVKALLFFFTIFLHYCSHWQIYLVGYQRFYKFDVTEYYCYALSLYVISAVFGSLIWSYNIPYINIEVGLIPQLLLLGTSCYSFYEHVIRISEEGAGKNGSTVAGSSILSPTIPSLYVGMLVRCVLVTVEAGADEDFWLYAFGFGVVATKYTIKLTLSTMTRSELEYTDAILIGLLVLYLNHWTGFTINEHNILCICFVYVVCDFIHYCVILCKQLCEDLNIEVFKISGRTLLMQGIQNDQPTVLTRLGPAELWD